MGLDEVTKKTKNMPKSEKSETAELKQQIRSLKSKLRSRDKTISTLRSDVKTLQSSFNKSLEYIDDELAHIPIEDLVRYFARKKKGKIDEVIEDHKNKVDEQIEKWTCYQCESGYLALHKIKKVNEMYYFRACINEKCKHKTKLKKYHDGVEGVENIK